MAQHQDENPGVQDKTRLTWVEERPERTHRPMKSRKNAGQVLARQHTDVIVDHIGGSGALRGSGKRPVVTSDHKSEKGDGPVDIDGHQQRVQVDVADDS